jgi:hypothetical protein
MSFNRIVFRTLFVAFINILFILPLGVFLAVTILNMEITLGRLCIILLLVLSFPVLELFSLILNPYIWELIIDRQKVTVIVRRQIFMLGKWKLEKEIKYVSFQLLELKLLSMIFDKMTSLNLSSFQIKIILGDYIFFFLVLTKLNKVKL